MPEYIPDLPIPSDEFVSINSLSGVAVGTAMTIQSKSALWVRLVESATKPLSTITDGVLMSSLYQNYAIATVKTSSLEVWAITVSSNINNTAKLSIQES